MSETQAKRGKPAADPENVREHRVQCMVSESEMNDLKTAAAEKKVTLSKLLYGPIRRANCTSTSQKEATLTRSVECVGSAVQTVLIVVTTAI